MRPAAALLLIGCAHAAAAPEGFALAKDRAVEVCLHLGEKQWLDRLRCADGERPQIEVMGSVGPRTTPLDPNDPRLLLQLDAELPIAPGQPDLHMVQAVHARCGSKEYTLYIDMYHCPGTDQPPPDHFKF
jgi:hypothetical protein